MAIAIHRDVRPPGQGSDEARVPQSLAQSAGQYLHLGIRPDGGFPSGAIAVGIGDQQAMLGLAFNPAFSVAIVGDHRIIQGSMIPGSDAYAGLDIKLIVNDQQVVGVSSVTPVELRPDHQSAEPLRREPRGVLLGL